MLTPKNNKYVLLNFEMNLFVKFHYSLILKLLKNMFV